MNKKKLLLITGAIVLVEILVFLSVELFWYMHPDVRILFTFCKINLIQAMPFSCPGLSVMFAVWIFLLQCRYFVGSGLNRRYLWNYPIYFGIVHKIDENNNTRNRPLQLANYFQNFTFSRKI